MDIGDISERKAIRQRLKCHSFKWYLENVIPEKFIPDEKVLAWGMVSKPFSCALSGFSVSYILFFLDIHCRLYIQYSQPIPASRLSRIYTAAWPSWEIFLSIQKNRGRFVFFFGRGFFLAFFSHIFLAFFRFRRAGYLVLLSELGVGPWSPLLR